MSAGLQSQGDVQWPAYEWNNSLSGGAPTLLEGKKLDVEPNAQLGGSQEKKGKTV